MRISAVCTAVLVSCCTAGITDFNQDHKTDAQDFIVFSQAWQTQAGDPNYNEQCDLSASADQYIDLSDFAVFLDDWLWQAIRLDIYSDGWGTYRETHYFENEGTAVFPLTNPGDPYTDYTYYAYAIHRDYFTEMYAFTGVVSGPPFHRTITVTVPVDLDPTDLQMSCGVIFLTQRYFKPILLKNTEVAVLDRITGEFVTTFTTDAQGRFATELPAGAYLLDFYEYPEEPFTRHIEEVITNGLNNTFLFPASAQALKPNIYLYPEVTTFLEVTVDFPSGGMITQSEPQYHQGWCIKADPSGLIDDQYRYLFYESIQPNKGQHDYGWVVAQQDLEIFFRQNLQSTGFTPNEIDDFIVYWIPLLGEFCYYVICPQYNETLDKMIRLNFSCPPDNLIRVIYSIHGISEKTFDLPEPAIPSFSREGFTIAEWGVILE